MWQFLQSWSSSMLKAVPSRRLVWSMSATTRSHKQSDLDVEANLRRDQSSDPENWRSAISVVWKNMEGRHPVTPQQLSDVAEWVPDGCPFLSYPSSTAFLQRLQIAGVPSKLSPKRVLDKNSAVTAAKPSSDPNHLFHAWTDSFKKRILSS